jgi:hypothetical protein
MLNALIVSKMPRFRSWSRLKRIREPNRIRVIIPFENYSWLNEHYETLSR